MKYPFGNNKKKKISKIITEYSGQPKTTPQTAAAVPYLVLNGGDNNAAGRNNNVQNFIYQMIPESDNTIISINKNERPSYPITADYN